MICPRRIEVGAGAGSPFQVPDEDSWSGDHRCSWCGSLAPEEFFRRVEAGEEVIPTDKSYKAYIGSERWKFYFQHLSDDERRRFIDLYNAKTMRLGYPGHFYTLPFFVKANT